MLSYEDIIPGTTYYRSKEIRREKNPNGTWKRIMKGEEYFETKMGEMLEDEWEKLADQTVREHGDTPLLEAIEDHVRDYCKWLRPDEVHLYSLRCLVRKIYLAWAERGEFDFIQDNDGEEKG